MKIIPDIFEQIVDNIREYSIITDYNNLSGQIYEFETDDLKSLQVNDYIDFPDSNLSAIEGYKITEIDQENLTFKITVEANIIPLYITIWKAKKPYSFFGDYNDLIALIKERDESKRFKYQKYPLIGLLKYTENVQNSLTIESEATMDLIIINQSDPNWSPSQRLDNNYRGIIYPLHDKFMNEIINNVDRFFFIEQNETLTYTRENNPLLIGTEAIKVNSFVDALEISNLNLKILK